MSSHSLQICLLSLGLSIQLTLQACPGLYPHPTRCDKFYKCDAHSSYLFHCPHGTLFDPQLGLCNHQYLVKCQLESQTTTTRPPPTTASTTIQPQPAITSTTSSSTTTTSSTTSTTSSSTTSTTTTSTSTTTTSASTTTEFPASQETVSSSSEILLTDDNNIFIDLSKPSTLPPELSPTLSPEEVVPEINIPGGSVPVTPPVTEVSSPEPEWSVSVSSLYPCSQPGYYREDSSCDQFFVCKEVAPGVLSADRIFR